MKSWAGSEYTLVVVASNSVLSLPNLKHTGVEPRDVILLAVVLRAWKETSPVDVFTAVTIHLLPPVAPPPVTAGTKAISSTAQKVLSLAKVTSCVFPETESEDVAVALALLKVTSSYSTFLLYADSAPLIFLKIVSRGKSSGLISVTIWETSRL